MDKNTWNLSGKKALVTGATHGMGKAIADAYLAKGAEVFITARNTNQIQKLLSTWKETGYTAYGVACDVTQPRQREILIKQVRQQWDNLDILVNNVGPNFKKVFLSIR